MFEIARWMTTVIMATLSATGACAAVDWSQPPVACVEEIVPALPNRNCLDLSKLADPLKGFPDGLPDDEAGYWKNHKPALYYCRAQEIFRRERANPGSQDQDRLETAWMRLVAVENSERKVAAVYEASRRYHVPAQILTGALYQESIFAALGIAEDGGNYSCGIGQINISEWCGWAARQRRLDPRWPRSVGDCGSVGPMTVKPFFDLAKERLRGEPEYKLAKRHFAGLKFETMAGRMEDADEATKRRRYDLVMAFVENCSDARDGIYAKAHELARLYRDFVPAGFKSRELYAADQKFRRQCADRGEERLYPLHLGWLMAVGVYNAGPRAIDSLAYYNGWSAGNLQTPATLDGFTAVDVVKSLYWAGAYDPESDKIAFATLGGAMTSWIWYKPCVLQRHLARVVQHVTLPGVPNLVDSLDRGQQCAKSRFDPVSGKVIQSAVPRARQMSSGRK